MYIIFTCLASTLWNHILIIEKSPGQIGESYERRDSQSTGFQTVHKIVRTNHNTIAFSKDSRTMTMMNRRVSLMLLLASITFALLPSVSVAEAVILDDTAETNHNELRGLGRMLKKVSMTL